uniref:ATP synthase complex subunit 8 n=1 Tax=Astyanax lacustris TaxID=1053555 RepID=A0A7M1LBJ1_9TELE|nr:ATP synthase F0 subunit 8 [Astyanax lacustris]QOQ85777.1 ATP synthase F0 subunit 8 [Astyanax lacustris]
MPQLMLNPWLFILVSSWMIFLLVIPSKVMKHYFNNEPQEASAYKPETTAWSWVWH